MKIFELAPGAASNDLWIGSLGPIGENMTPENTRLIDAYARARYKLAPDQFSARAYDAMYIVGPGAEEAAQPERP